MLTASLDYNLPKELIAQQPIEPRDHSRLFVFDTKLDKVYHKHFYDLGEFVNSTDTLVANNSKVFPARLFGVKSDTGGNIEVLLLEKQGINTWEAMIKGRVSKGIEIGIFDNDNNVCLTGVIKDKKDDGLVMVELQGNEQDVLDKIYRFGHTPTPPYVKEVLKDHDRYQTVFAKKYGSAAAPTAGLHFTEDLMNSLKEKGVKFDYVDLHVGLGTFKPIETEQIEDYNIHREYFEANNIDSQKQKTGRRIAVGTTSIRVLETIAKWKKIPKKADSFCDLKVKDNKITGWTKIYIKPGDEFHAVDGLITNFHWPKTSLIALVAAFIGTKQSLTPEESVKKVLELYRVAIERKYRFYSFGDAMLIV